jgi:uncharacterized protein YkwD
MARRLAVLGLLAALAFTQAGGCHNDDDDDDDSGSGSPPPPACGTNPPYPGSSGDGQNGATLTYSSNGHPLNWLTTDATTLAYEDQILTLVNAHRCAMGRNVLTMDVTIRRCARGHSRHLRSDVHNFMDTPDPHTNPEGDSPGDRLTKNGVSWTLAAENIAAGYVTPQNAFNAWLGSPGHRANIERTGISRTGVGYQPGAAGDTYSDYWTQVFAN